MAWKSAITPLSRFKLKQDFISTFCAHKCSRKGQTHIAPHLHKSTDIGDE